MNEIWPLEKPARVMGFTQLPHARGIWSTRHVWYVVQLGGNGRCGGEGEDDPTTSSTARTFHASTTEEWCRDLSSCMWWWKWWKCNHCWFPSCLAQGGDDPLRWHVPNAEGTIQEGAGEWLWRCNPLIIHRIESNLIYSWWIPRVSDLISWTWWCNCAKWQAILIFLTGWKTENSIPWAIMWLR